MLEHVVGPGVQRFHHPRLVRGRRRHDDDPRGDRAAEVAAHPHHVEVAERAVDDDDVRADLGQLVDQ